MTKTEQEVIRGVVRKLRGEHAVDEVRDALTGVCGTYLESWVIPALELLLPEGTSRSGEKRDPKLAKDLIS